MVPDDLWLRQGYTGKKETVVFVCGLLVQAAKNADIGAGGGGLCGGEG